MLICMGAPIRDLTTVRANADIQVLLKHGLRGGTENQDDAEAAEKKRKAELARQAAASG